MRREGRTVIKSHFELPISALPDQSHVPRADSGPGGVPSRTRADETQNRGSSEHLPERTAEPDVPSPLASAAATSGTPASHFPLSAFYAVPPRRAWRRLPRYRGHRGMHVGRSSSSDRQPLPIIRSSALPFAVKQGVRLHDAVQPIDDGLREADGGGHAQTRAIKTLHAKARVMVGDIAGRLTRVLTSMRIFLEDRIRGAILLALYCPARCQASSYTPDACSRFTAGYHRGSAPTIRLWVYLLLDLVRCEEGTSGDAVGREELQAGLHYVVYEGISVSVARDGRVEIDEGGHVYVRGRGGRKEGKRQGLQVKLQSPKSIIESAFQPGTKLLRYLLTIIDKLG